MSLKRFAFIVSRCFDFYTWFPLGLLLAIFNTGLASDQIKILLPLLIFFDVILPIFLFFLILKMGRVSDIDVTKREERYQLFIGFTIILIVPTVLAYYFGNTLFFVLQLITLISALCIFLATLKFKISGHMFMNAEAIFVINYLFHWTLLWLFLILPLVAFARIYLKKHNLFQIFAGCFLGLVIPFLILKIFKFI